MITETGTIKLSFSPDDVIRLRKDYPLYKVLLRFYSEEDEDTMPTLIKKYVVWITEAFVKNSGKIDHDPDDSEVMWAAEQEVAGRWQESDPYIPEEDGLDCSLKGVKRITGGEAYRHPVEDLPQRRIIGYRMKPIIGAGRPEIFPSQLVKVPVYGSGLDIG